MLRGLGASEGWTDTFVSATAHDDVDLVGPAVRVANPLDAEKPFLRRSLLPGLLGALAYNASRRQPDVRLFEVGVVFSHPGAGMARVVERSGAGGTERAELPGERELLSAVFAGDEDDARSAVAAWHVLADALRLDGVRLVPPGDGTPPLPGLHPTRSAHLMARAGSLDEVTIGAVGEIDPAVAARFDLTRTSGGGDDAPAHRLARGRPGPALRRGAGAPPHHRSAAPSAASRRRTSTWPSWWRTASGRRRRRRAAERRGRTAGVGAPLRRLPRHRHRRGRRAAWPTGCASAPTTAP